MTAKLSQQENKNSWRLLISSDGGDGPSADGSGVGFEPGKPSLFGTHPGASRHPSGGGDFLGSRP